MFNHLSCSADPLCCNWKALMHCKGNSPWRGKELNYKRTLTHAAQREDPHLWCLSRSDFPGAATLSCFNGHLVCPNFLPVNSLGKENYTTWLPDLKTPRHLRGKGISRPSHTVASFPFPKESFCMCVFKFHWKSTPALSLFYLCTLSYM